MNIDIKITEKAAEFIKDIIEGQELKEPYLNFSVVGGGCSGLKYGLALADGEPEIDDIITEDKNIKICLDPYSAKYLNGCIVDYVDNDETQGFKIENPNATKTCGCENSFSVDGEEIDSCGGCGYK
jgi:iron-sulfur cluster assembly protein